MLLACDVSKALTRALAKQAERGIDTAAPSSADTQAPAQGAAVQAAQVQDAQGEASPVGTVYDGQGQVVQVLPFNAQGLCNALMLRRLCGGPICNGSVHCTWAGVH